MARTVLVTGGAGFIGSKVADRLLEQGQRVIALDSFDPYYDPAQKERNVTWALGQRGYELVRGDVRSRESVGALFERVRPDAVVHLAARAGVRASVEDPVSYVEVNELGGLAILDAARAAGNVPVVFASTSSVYGATDRVPFREDDPAVGPLSPYAATKRGAELMAHALHHLHRQPICLVRFFTVYGPRGRPDMAVHSFTRKLLAREPILLHGEDTQRDFTYVDDIVEGVLGAITWVCAAPRLGTFNLGRSEPVRVRRLIELLAEALGVPAHVELGALGASESPVTAADVSAARSAFGYEPRVSLEEGIARWVEWCRQSDEAAAELRGPL
ncbi:MAG: SDR family NAD(P)-dependent oxidoreductase [Polyangiaceae bacterium]|nr:SDR family NAD(P)-dependent oxidoreductase [Polyangiaceae bacterium]